MKGEPGSPAPYGEKGDKGEVGFAGNYYILLFNINHIIFHIDIKIMMNLFLL